MAVNIERAKCGVIIRGAESTDAPEEGPALFLKAVAKMDGATNVDRDFMIKRGACI